VKRRAVEVEVSDHAVLRWLEREHGLDVGAVKAMIAGIVKDGAELEAASVVLGHVRFVLKDRTGLEGEASGIVVVTTAKRHTLRVQPRRGARELRDG
jgi:Iap family predicted aminopeptidase